MIKIPSLSCIFKMPSWMFDTRDPFAQDRIAIQAALAEQKATDARIHEMIRRRKELRRSASKS